MSTGLIENNPPLGYVAGIMSAESNPSMSPEQLLQGWTPRRIGRRILVLPETACTNHTALDAAGEPEADGLVVLTDYQTAGRGRQGRIWESPRGASLLCSALLLIDEPHLPEQDSGTQAPEPGNTHARVAGWLTLASAVAACEAIRQATEVTPAIKWPNDLQISGKKLAGILVESRPVSPKTRAWVVGIGINCLQQRGHFPPELRDTAISLELAASHPIDRLALTRRLLQSLDKWLGPPNTLGSEAIHAAWLTYAEPVGRRVRLRQEGREYTGRTVAVDPFGGLIVQGDDGRQEWFDPMLTTML